MVIYINTIKSKIMGQRQIIKLNLIEILKRELILNSAYEKSLINLIKPAYDLKKTRINSIL
jgi:hypothetical protein